MNAICSRSGCARPGYYFPVLHVWATVTAPEDRTPERAASVTLKLPVCRRCKPRVKLGEVCTDEAWKVIEQTFSKQKAAPPDRDSLRLAWVPIRWADAEERLSHGGKPTG